MYFVKTEELKTGMRLARPIYNHTGVLLFEQGSKLTGQGIGSISNFGLLGVYILEPAEPVPPMTQEDIEFEQFQAAYVYQIQKELDEITETRKTVRIDLVVGGISKTYAHKDKKINFIQTPRTREDYDYKHTLNVAILCTLMAYRMKLKVDECRDIITAAVMHDIGVIQKNAIQAKEQKAADLTEEVAPDAERRMLLKAESDGFAMIEDLFSSRPSIRRYCQQAARLREDFKNEQPPSLQKAITGSEILLIADYYDKITSVRYQQEAQSEVYCVKKMIEHPEFFHPTVLKALTDSINIIVPGVSVELNSGDKGLVLAENDRNILRPVLLLFRNNEILDLSIRDNHDLEIVDIMKTLDNRYIMDFNKVKQMGFQTDGERAE